MQQLKTLQFRLQGHALLIDNLPSYADADMQLFCQSLCHGLQATLLAMESGADRLQCRFELDGSIFILYLESLCEAAWVEAFYHTDIAVLAQRLALVGAQQLAPQHQA
ncbi:DUF3630 family protein [Bowmanella denitrificans]|uniref:DUF3630 family protein n=1 Tax=Bowmanella denitrificans TaxID=366582 RepID=UPI000C9AE514|nr:DUF3630 family protein [Bowmanella denitrificans]